MGPISSFTADRQRKRGEGGGEREEGSKKGESGCERGEERESGCGRDTGRKHKTHCYELYVHMFCYELYVHMFCYDPYVHMVCYDPIRGESSKPISSFTADGRRKSGGERETIHSYMYECNQMLMYVYRYIHIFIYIVYIYVYIAYIYMYTLYI